MQFRVSTKIRICTTILTCPATMRMAIATSSTNTPTICPKCTTCSRKYGSVVDKYPGDPVLVTEADEPNVEALTKMYGNDDEVQLPMDFQIADVNRALRAALSRAIQ